MALGLLQNGVDSLTNRNWTSVLAAFYSYTSMCILRNCGSLFLSSVQIPLFVLSQHAILAHTVGSVFIYYEIFHVCLLFKVQQYFVNLLYHFRDLLNEI